MNQFLFLCLLLSSFLFTALSFAHDKASATYLGNEAVLVQDGESKVLFDPFFHKDYGRFQLVPESIQHKIMAGTAPYDGIDAVFISHAHGDHFDVQDVIQYLNKHKEVVLIAPQQAIEQMLENGMDESLLERTKGQKMQPGESPKVLEFGSIRVEVLRIPHAGWPSWQDVDNFLYRVVLNKQTSVMHLGDADDNQIHFQPYQEHLQANPTQVSFPPFWFLVSPEGQFITDQMLNTEKTIGIHVPVKVPPNLKASGRSYFSKPEESIQIEHKH